MNKEIKFRLIRNKKIVGYERHRLSYTDKTIYLIIEHSPDGIGFCDIFRMDVKRHWIEHDIKDQYTGKKDKNGVEIYDEDFISDPSSRVIYEVFWNDSKAQWYACRINFIAGVADGTPLYRFTEGAYYEVFGNRHDNPKLLEEQP